MKRILPREGAVEAGILGAVLAGALGIRLLGVNRGLPYIHEWDEPTTLSSVIRMLQHGDLNPREWIYPTLYLYMLLPVMYLHYLYLHAHGLLSSLRDIQLSQPQEQYWYMHPASFYAWGRAFTGLVSTATAFLVYRIGKTVYGTAVGLLAAAFLAVAPGAVYYSATVRVDIPVAFFVTLTVLVALGIIRRGRWQDYVLSGLLAGLAMSTKQNAFMVTVALLVAHFLNVRRTRLLDLRLVGMGLSALAGIIIGTPYVLIYPNNFYTWGVRATSSGYGGIPTLAGLRQVLPLYLDYFVRASQGQEWFVTPHTAIGLLPAIAALIGIAAGFSWDRRVHTYLLSFPLSYFLLMSSQRGLSLRQMTVVIPFAALFAAAGCVWTWRWLQRHWPAANGSRAPVLAGLALVALLAAPARDATMLGWTLGRQPDTRTAAVVWLQRHVAPGARIAFEDDLRWHVVDLEHIPYSIRFAPRDAGPDWYLQRHINFAVIGDESPLRSLPAAAVFPRPAYMGVEVEYPVIDPVLFIVRPKIPQVNAVFPLEIRTGDMILDPGASNAAGVSSETVRLPEQQFAPDTYTIAVSGDWPQPGASSADWVTAKVIVGQMTVGTATVTNTQPLRFTTPPFRIDRSRTLPVRVELAYRTRRQPEQMRALRPATAGCATAGDAPTLDIRQMTLEAWVYPEGMNEPPDMRARGLESEAPILSKGKHLGYYLRLVGDSNGSIFADLSAAGKFSIARAQFVPLRHWTHIAATYDGGEARIYLNGAEAQSQRDPHYVGDVRPQGSPLTIGCRDPGTPDQAMFHGSITGVRIWNRVLSADDLRVEATPGERRLPETSAGLVGSWSFQSIDRGIVPDLSGHGNNLSAKALQPIPIGTGPSAGRVSTSGPANLLSAVTIYGTVTARSPVPSPAPPPQPALQTTELQTIPSAAQANPRKARQAEPLAAAVKAYYAQRGCYPEMVSGGAGMPPALKEFLAQPWPPGFIYETQTRAMGWQMGAGTVYYVDFYYPGDTPAWNGPGSGRVYIVHDKPVKTC
ncbi:MAG: LamG-like jellyroll fold domain-containing protein [bacterium]